MPSVTQGYFFVGLFIYYFENLHIRDCLERGKLLKYLINLVENKLVTV